ncbi:MAG TPA: GAF and ANTAR domain-containing protein [Kineosporiaceae bacterium]|nr:GAF and ANTAR domain-containing protein [Kineosporiaceae bacterium]
MPTVSPQRLAEVFVEVADTLVDEFDVIEFLQLVSVRTVELFDAGAVGLLLADEHGELQFMAASDEAAKLLEIFEVQHREGPCLDAFLSGEVVSGPEIETEADRWPLFAPRAIAAGFCSVYAVPMRLRGEVIGAVNVFGRRAGEWDVEDLRIVQALVDVATIGLLQERVIRRGEVLTEQLQGALNSRVVIEQAKGALAQLRQISVDEAFELMRSFARRNGRALSAVAQTVVSDDRSGIADLTGE